MSTRDEQLARLMREIRTCFNQLKSLAGRLHEDLGVNPSMRAVMESLAGGGRQTVSDLARCKGVSRQHVQAIMNALLADGLVVAVENPAHRRSPLFDLTNRGRATFAAIGAREREPLERIAAGLTLASLQQARTTLEQLNSRLAAEIIRGETDEAAR